MKTAKHLFGLAAIALAVSAHAAPIAEGFDSVAALAGSGWLQVNASANPGQPWFQGNDGIFGSQTGAPTSYVAADFLSAGLAGGDISNWLISPVLTLDPSSVLSFFTRSTGTPGFEDSLEVYFSAGSGSALGGFSSLGTIGVSSAYPSSWTQFLFSLPSVATGRFAFRQGSTADSADYIGIDTVSVSGVAVSVPEPSTYALMALGIAGLALVRRGRRSV
jgi:hypothetical protein